MSPRPIRTNRGQGGVVARLAATAAQIRPDLEPQLAKQCKNTVTPANASVNAMAPAKKSKSRAWIVTANQPTRNDPPLSLATLKPLLLQGGPSSTFGFAQGVDPTDEAVDARGNPSVDNREVAPHAMEDGLDHNINEASPDEDKRWAQQFLRSPEENPHPQHDELIQPHVSREDRYVGDRLSTSHGSQRSQLLSPEGVDKYNAGEGQGSQSVLQVYRQKNGAIRPPNPDALLARAGQPLGGTSDTHGNVAMHDRTASEDDDNSSDDNGTPAPHSTRTFRPIKLAKPINLRFYSGIWRDVLITSKTYHRLAIHAESNLPFPEHDKDGLQNAHECILEAIGHLENGKLAKFDDQVIKKCFSKELEPHLPFDHNSEQKRQVISEAVQAIIRGSQFLRRAELDENNFAHPAIIELCKQFYYSGKLDCLSVLFPYHFVRLPASALTMACTCISNCLSEWESGIQVQTSFTGRVYEAVYITMWDLINETMQNDYHRRKLRVLLKRIAKEGRFVSGIIFYISRLFIYFLAISEQNLAQRGDTSSPAFTVNLN
ncbi:hypothetical protein EDB83DRAFT_2537489 [Lactarius deliciosus]|nr:hypothetical protein EDB83DRAFT_2537489 [Lactarius deliciosus]